MKFRCLAPSPVPIPPPATRLQALFVRNAPIGFHHSIPPLIPLSHHSHFPIPRFSPHSDYNSIINIVTAIRLKASFNGRDFRARSSSPDSPPPPPSPSSISQQVIVSSAFTIAFAVANRVLYKLALVPMKEYPFFLAQLTTFGYVIVYFVILYMRYNGGVVTDEMMAQPKSLYVAIGVLEALGVALGMVAAAMLPGPAIPILSQTFFVWQLILSVFILGRTYTISQIAGCLLVAIGVAVAVTSGSNANQLLYGVELVWPVLMIASSAFQAGASIIKEFVFIDAASRLKGKTLDIFVVNSFGSGFQALFVLLFLPFLSSMKGIPFAQLPSYFKSGVGCFLNIGASTSGCEGSPLLPLLYIATNLMFNVSVLNLVKTSSAVVSSLAVMLSVPISIYILSIPLPYLPVTSSLGPFFLFGSWILVLGLILYTLPQASKQH
ncbi:protein CLT2, chloroplastic isoform X1 [Humulus lupulus]|uniref:protein CLT2, chloroplastic isoform X1 n=1 Tax=Humulus lupulus TaxID=3486 RepID=UPI002B416D5B|nr:protein CLT2, chloroplastic isoform X1 [Humulus lupulus]